MADLVEVFRSAHTPTAQLVRSALISEGIDAHIVGEHLAGMIGAASRILPARVLVPDHQEAEARTALAVIEARADAPPDASEPTTCPACGADWEPGFDVCWQCEAERP